jgi:hypothetical protein
MQELAPLMHAVAAALLGEPNKHHLKPGELRYGSHGSLSIDLRKGTYFDHEAGKGGGVLDLVRRVKGFDNGEAIRWLRDEGILEAEASSRQEKFIEAAYDYTDEHGKLIFQAIRFGFRHENGSRVLSKDGKPKKSFAQRRPDGSSWVWNLKDVRPVPYRLPQLIEAIADDKQIFIAEGEKCVDRLIAAGLAATCNAAGAGKWPPELTEHFAGAKVVILRDNDEAGRNHGALVAEKLQGTAESVLIVDLPGLPEKGDVVNWLDAGHDGAELQELVATAVPPEAAPSAQPIIKATPFEWCPPHLLPRRQFVYGRHAVRGYVSITSAPGGVGKTALKLAESIALVTGRELLGERVPAATPVWYLGLEDPLLEYKKRVTAAALHHGIADTELAGLFLDSGRDQNFIIVTEERLGVKIAEPKVEAIITNIRERNIGQIVVDPFIGSHAVSENDNTKIEKVAREWARIADVANCAVEFVHHVRKGNGQADASADDIRGGSALVNAARFVRLLTPMSKEEATQANISERRRFFKVTVGKANMFLPPETAEWFELKTVSLGNGNGGPDDEMQVATRWTWPNAFDGLQVADLDKVQDRIAAGEWAENIQASDWAGYAVAEVLGLNISDPAAKSRVKSLLRTWIGSGALKVERVRSGRQGRVKPIVIVGAR